MDIEQRLIRKIQKIGDRASTDELVRRYYDEIYRFARKQTADHETALDLTQEIFIAVLKTIGRYDPKKGAGFRTWLYKIAADKMVDFFRSHAARQAKVVSIDEVCPIDETDFTLQFEDNSFAEQVCAYVNTLPSDTQKIFRLHIFGDYTFAEIAQNLQMPESSVKTKYYRLINALRKELANDR